jgi:glycosyltransferase involved in cell wall biosynthesis
MSDLAKSETAVKTISIVTPCFNEEGGIRECYESVRDILSSELKEYEYEHIFCDNASTDRTVEILREIARSDTRAKIIINSRNFGPLRSTYNGVMSATGDAVLLFLPVDLQDPPSLLPEFVKLWRAGYEVVYGIRAERTEPWIMRSMRSGFYRLLTKFSDLDVPPGVGDFQLVDRKVVEAMRHIQDTQPFMRMMTFECGFRAVGVPYRWQTRRHGSSKNTFLRLFDQAMNGFVTFTVAPVRLALFAGFSIAVLSIVYSLISLVIGMLYYQEIAAPGIMTIITAIFFFSGVQLFVIGMIGEYILGIHSLARKRPLVFERERINFGPTQDNTSQRRAG